MGLYLICYDIHEADHDYASLFERLSQLKAERVLESVWLFAHSGEGMGWPLTADLWENHMRPNDGLLVQEVGGLSGWANLNISDEQMNQLRAVARF